MQHIKTYNTSKGKYKIHLTRLDQSAIDPKIYSWDATVYDDRDNPVLSHYFSLDDVYWGKYDMEYMFKRMIFDIDRMEEEYE